MTILTIGEVTGHFGPKTFRYQRFGSEVSRHFGLILMKTLQTRIAKKNCYDDGWEPDSRNAEYVEVSF